jgi:KDO2-lipid IV(A) lauroyltransferase
VLSLLPLRVLYLFSDFIYFLVYYCFGYRKEVVMTNLSIAFPAKSEIEKTRIAKDFFHLFIDTFIETIKLISISEKEFLKRFDFDSTLLESVQKNNQKIQLHSGHFFNYEFMNLGLALHKNSHQWLGIYAQLSNKAFDEIIYDMRSKFGTTLISSKNFRNKFHQYTSSPYMLGLAADQNTHNPNNAYWSTFFGKKTPFVKGPEKGAKTMSTAIVMVYIYPVKRGYYKMETSLLTTEPNNTNTGFITNALVKFIEEKIQQHPANYLWSHKRWKHEFDAEQYGHLVID